MCVGRKIFTALDLRCMKRLLQVILSVKNKIGEECEDPCVRRLKERAKFRRWIKTKGPPQAGSLCLQFAVRQKSLAQTRVCAFNRWVGATARWHRIRGIPAHSVSSACEYVHHPRVVGILCRRCTCTCTCASAFWACTSCRDAGGTRLARTQLVHGTCARESAKAWRGAPAGLRHGRTGLPASPPG